MAKDEPVPRSMSLLQRAFSGGRLKRSRAGSSSETLRSCSSDYSSSSSPPPVEWEAVPAKGSSSSWKVLDENVPAVPLHFPIMDTHVTVHGETAADVAERIEQCLAEWSISARFNSDKAKVVAETLNRVRFCIRMFRDDQGGILVEVQRRSSGGGCMGFHKVAMAILRAAEGAGCSKDAVSETNTPRKASDLPKAAAMRQSLRTMKHVHDAVDSAERLVQSQRVDAKLLGVQSLDVLTDSSAMGDEVSRVAAHTVLSSSSSSSSRDEKSCRDASQVVDAKDNAKCEEGRVHLSEVIRELVEFPVETNEEDSEYNHGPIRRYMELLHSHALSVVTNSVSTLSVSGELASILDSDAWYAQTLIPVLLREISEAHWRPHDASVALRCLTFLQVSPECQNATGGRGLNALLAKAGVFRHAMLRREFQQAASTMLFRHPHSMRRTPHTTVTTLQ